MKDIFNREISVGDRVLALCNRGELKPITVLEVKERGTRYWDPAGVVAETDASVLSWDEKANMPRTTPYKTKRVYAGPFYKLEEGCVGYEQG